MDYGDDYTRDGEEFDVDETVRRAADDAAPDGPDGESSIWDEDEAFDNLKMERAVHTDETNEQLTKRLIEAAGPMAAQAIIHIALRDGNGNTRLRAATYITDKIYGDDSGKTGEKLWEKLLGDAVKEIEDHANAGG